MESANLKSWNDLSRLQGEEKWRFMSLVTMDGEILVPYNNNKTTPENKWREIKRKMQSKLLPDGVYLFKAKNTPGSRGVEDKIFVAKGDFNKVKKEFQTRPASEVQPVLSAQARLSDPVQSTPAVLTWAQALSNVQEIADLKRDKQLLQEQITRLQKENEEIKAELSELQDDDDAPETNGMASWIKDIFPSIDQGIDRYFTLREKELNQRDAILRAKGIPVSGNGLHRMGPTAINDGTQDVQEATERFLQYLDSLLEQKNYNLFNREMATLAKTNPDLWNRINAMLQQEGIDTNGNAS